MFRSTVLKIFASQTHDPVLYRSVCSLVPLWSQIVSVIISHQHTQVIRLVYTNTDFISLSFVIFLLYCKKTWLWLEERGVPSPLYYDYNILTGLCGIGSCDGR